jgi:transcriptional regulator
MQVQVTQMTIRRKIIQLLSEGNFSARGISQALRISEKEVYEHLPHVEKSLGRGENLICQPARCMDCSFVFIKRKRFTTPGRCPVCRSEAISVPLYGIAMAQ